MKTILFENMDVAEMYNRPGIAQMAHKIGLRVGWGSILTTCDEQSKYWEFNCQRMRNEAVRKFTQGKPRLFIGNPMCGPFSAMNTTNYNRMTEEEKQHKIANGKKHLEFCMKLYETQLRERRYFLHGHPNTANPWQK